MLQYITSRVKRFPDSDPLAHKILALLANAAEHENELRAAGEDTRADLSIGEAFFLQILSVPEDNVFYEAGWEEIADDIHRKFGSLSRDERLDLITEARAARLMTMTQTNNTTTENQISPTPTNLPHNTLYLCLRLTSHSKHLLSKSLSKFSLKFIDEFKSRPPIPSSYYNEELERYLMDRDVGVASASSGVYWSGVKDQHVTTKYFGRGGGANADCSVRDVTEEELRSLNKRFELIVTHLIYVEDVVVCAAVKLKNMNIDSLPCANQDHFHITLCYSGDFRPVIARSATEVFRKIVKCVDGERGELMFLPNVELGVVGGGDGGGAGVGGVASNLYVYPLEEDLVLDSVFVAVGGGGNNFSVGATSSTKENQRQNREVNTQDEDFIPASQRTGEEHPGLPSGIVDGEEWGDGTEGCDVMEGDEVDAGDWGGVRVVSPPATWDAAPVVSVPIDGGGAGDSGDSGGGVEHPSGAWEDKAQEADGPADGDLGDWCLGEPPEGEVEAGWGSPPLIPQSPGPDWGREEE